MPPLRLRVAATLLMVVLVGAAGWLGWWQVEAWQARRAAEARDLTQLDPVPMTDVMGNDDPFPGSDVGRPVSVAGEWISDATFWVEGREHDGTDGFWAVTLLSVGDAGQPAVPVVLGWTPEPDTTPPTGSGEVVGWLQPPEGSTATDDDASDAIYPELRVSDAIQLVDVDLYGAYVVADPDRTPVDDTAGLVAADLDALPEPSRFTAARNLLYGIEWFVFGGFAFFVWWRWLRDARNSEAAVEEAAREESPVAG